MWDVCPFALLITICTTRVTPLKFCFVLFMTTTITFDIYNLNNETYHWCRPGLHSDSIFFPRLCSDNNYYLRSITLYTGKSPWCVYNLCRVTRQIRTTVDKLPIRHYLRCLQFVKNMPESRSKYFFIDWQRVHTYSFSHFHQVGWTGKRERKIGDMHCKHNNQRNKTKGPLATVWLPGWGYQINARVLTRLLRQANGFKYHCSLNKARGRVKSGPWVRTHVVLFPSLV